MKGSHSDSSRVSESQKALVLIEPTDPDNVALLSGAIAVFGLENVAVILTGRCAIHPKIVKERVADALASGLPRNAAIPMEEWDREYSTLLHKVSALRVAKLISTFWGDSCPIFDGGFSKRPRVPHALHIDDLFGFGDVEESEVHAVEEGTVDLVQPLSEVQRFLGDHTFVAFLGGPATGLKLLLEQSPHLIHQMTAVFGQFGSLGQVKGMEIAGRPEKAQFNVLLDPESGKFLAEQCEANKVPFYFLTSDVTRRGEIGFGTFEHLYSLLKPRSFGLLKLCAQWQIWYEQVVRPRAGELLLTHDMSCLLAYLQVIGACQPTYEFKSAGIVRFGTEGSEEGEIEFDLTVAEGSHHVAVKLLNRDVYTRELVRSLRGSERREIALSTSLSKEEEADPVTRRRFADTLVRVLTPLLDEGGVVHWGSHPSTREVMEYLSKIYPNQLVQHLLARFSASRIPSIRDENVHYHDDLVDLRVALLGAKDLGVFVAGRTDIKNTLEGRSGVLVEYVFFLAVNPTGKTLEYPLRDDDISSFIALNHSARILTSALDGNDFRAVGDLLHSLSTR